VEVARVGALDVDVVGDLADDERQALAIGADFFLGKPYDDRELMDRNLSWNVSHGKFCATITP